MAAVLAYALVGEVSGEEADDSDTDDQSAEDPELVGEQWDCLSCGLKNKPFVRYCSKCWQVGNGNCIKHTQTHTQVGRWVMPL